jgi:hypothetical protein
MCSTSRSVDVFNKGQAPFEFTAATSVPWIVLSTARGTIEKEQRIRRSAGLLSLLSLDCEDEFQKRDRNPCSRNAHVLLLSCLC